MIGFIGVYLPLFYLFISREKHRTRNKNKNIEKSKKNTHKELPLKYDIYRKLTHLVVLGIVLFYFTLGFLIQNFFIYLLEYIPDFISDIFRIGGDIMVFTQNLVVFLVGISLLGLLTADFVRILDPENYPLKPINRILREKELHFRVGPHISMSIGCFSIIIIFGLIQPIGPVVICTSMIMSIFGDITSNLVGRTMGRNRIRKTSKTYEGLISGIAASFISGVIILYLLRNYYRFNISMLFLIPLIGALIVGLLDYLDLEVDDNLTFNFCLSIVLFLISIPLL
jgi:dolichol kinase